MAGFELEIEQLRRAAVDARSGGDQLGKVDAVATVGGVPAALPGSRSGGQVATLGDTWRQQATFWSGGLIGHATSLTASAELYAANESAAAEVFTPIQEEY